jgi:hypothetical protein
VERLVLVGKLVERNELGWIELERLQLERFLVVGQLVERLVLVGKLVERFELERFELERQQLVGRIMARGELGPEIVGAAGGL